MQLLQFMFTVSLKNHPSADISYPRVIDQDCKQVVREVLQAIHIRINNLALNHNTGKMHIPEIFNSF